MTLLASETKGTNVALSMDGQLPATAANEIKLTAGISIAATNRRLVQCITSEPSAAFCSAIRVRDSWWSGPEVGGLESTHEPAPPPDPAAAPFEQFWEHVDVLDN